MLSYRIKQWAAILKSTPLHPQWLLRFGRSSKRLLQQHSSGRTLDIGCADRWPETWLPQGCDYISLDYPATGHELYGAHPDVFADAAALPFKAGKFDTVLLLEVLEHLQQPQTSLAEIARVLGPGGKLLLTVPFLYPMHDEPHDYQRYTRYGLMREIAAAGLEVEAIKPSLNSACSTGLLVNLALGGMLLAAIQKRSLALLLTPPIMLAVLLVNLLALCSGWLLPSWPAVTSGYNLIAYKNPREPRYVARKAASFS